MGNQTQSFSLSDEKQICFLLWIEFFVENNRNIDWPLSFDTASLCWSPDDLQEAVDQSREDEGTEDELTTVYNLAESYSNEGDYENAINQYKIFGFNAK